MKTIKNCREQFFMSAASLKGGGHDCMDAGGRATQDAVAEDARNKKASLKLAFFIEMEQG